MYFLEGKPDIVIDGKLKASESVEEMMQTDIGLETTTSEMYNRLAGVAIESKDRNSEKLFKSILQEEEQHLDDFESQRDQIGMMGIDIYYSRQVSDDIDDDDDDDEDDD